ncbi:MAG: hypothetical protein NZ580_04475 [Bacteroidia bacterium]|nr:hypothetical protein [Bacteroidia bacterium]
MYPVERRVLPRTASGCTAPTSSVQLDINNVRCLIHNGGDMWWDLANHPRYEVPKVPPGVPAIHSLFAGAVWVGGLDAAGRLRLAAQTYRQSGVDFFAGPLSLEGSTDASTCQQWDRHFVIMREEIDNFISTQRSNPQQADASNFPNVYAWPGTNPAPGFERNLAPYVDVDGNSEYNPSGGDYPKIDGDMAIWWVYNDKGNVHTETGAAPIGMEIQAMAFAFATRDDINSMTFYKYKLINRGSLALRQTYMAVWVDADLGNYRDDYVGCDTTRGLGYCYNGDNDDTGADGYGRNPPAIGTDFFQGPIGDDGNRLKMTNFMYYNNDPSVIGNPSNAIHFYNYMRSIWKDGSPLVANNRNGYGSGNPTNFIYAGDPARCAAQFNPPAPGWTEVSAGNAPDDRRYLQSAGPFTLQPGAVNEIVVGVPWARDINGIYSSAGYLGSVCLVYNADDLAQALFDNNFDLLDGPDAPDVEVVEMDREIMLKWSYKSPTSNNYYENYREFSPALRAASDPYYRFEGFLVYQLRDARVTTADLEDPNRAILIAQCDIRNGITSIVNRTTFTLPGSDQVFSVDKVMVDGKDEGLFYSFRVTEDKFAEGTDLKLVNYRKYYFTVVAYAYNDLPLSENPTKFIIGRRNIRVYEVVPRKIEFEKGGTVLTSTVGQGIPITRVAGTGNGGNELRLMPEVEQALFSSPYRATPLTYQPDRSPIRVRVVDPKSVRNYDYRLVLNLDTSRREMIVNPADQRDTLIRIKEWELYGRPAGSSQPYQLIYTHWGAISKRDTSTKSMWDFMNSQFLAGEDIVVPSHGISIQVRQVLDPGTHFYPDSLYPWLCSPAFGNTPWRMIQAPRNGIIRDTIEYADPSKPWLTFHRSSDTAGSVFNWVDFNAGGATVPNFQDICFRTGGRGLPASPTDSSAWVFFHDEPYKLREIFRRGWAPFGLATPFSEAKLSFGVSMCTYSSARDTCLGRLDQPLQEMQPSRAITLAKLPSVQLVITPDRTKWSKCLVLESTPSRALARVVRAGDPRMAKWRLSRDVIQGDTLAYRSGPLTVEAQGFSWFPGYAVILETGQRVNIVFAEASYYLSENGDDMLFNPTASLGSSRDAYGGRHWLIITTHPYDECKRFSEWLCVADSVSLDYLNRRMPIDGYTFKYRKPDGSIVRLDSFYRYAAWLAFPMVSSSRFQFKHYKDIPTEARVIVAVNKSFAPGSNGEPPTFEFSTAGFAPRTGDIAVAKSALDMIRVVPNPFYGRSGVGRGRYEVSQVDTRVKITNLPQRCNIRIFTLNGVLVRTFKKDSEEPNLEWDLKNEYGVPIASGVYILHIEAPGIGEKVVKFFCIMPQVDLNAY